MAKPELSILIKAKDEASRQLDQVNRNVGNMSANFLKAGGIMTAAGVAMAAALGMTVKAAAQEEAGIQRLRVAMRNVGLDYDANQEAIEGVIDATQQKTAVADDEQRDSLATLIRMTKDTTKALDLNALAMDIARGTGRDLASATTTLSYALGGNWGMVERLIPALKEAETEEEKWMMLRQLFQGQAEAYGQTMAGQFELLKNNIGDIAESIGAVLLPTVKDIAEKFNDFAQAIKELPPWMVDVGVKAVAAGTGLLLIGGPALMLVGLLPKLGAAFKSVGAGIGIMNAASMAAVGRLAMLTPWVAAIAALGSAVVERQAGDIEEARKQVEMYEKYISKMEAKRRAEGIEDYREFDAQARGMLRRARERLEALEEEAEAEEEVTRAKGDSSQATSDAEVATLGYKDALAETLEVNKQMWADTTESMSEYLDELNKVIDTEKQRAVAQYQGLEFIPAPPMAELMGGPRGMLYIPPEGPARAVTPSPGLLEAAKAQGILPTPAAAPLISELNIYLSSEEFQQDFSRVVGERIMEALRYM